MNKTLAITGTLMALNGCVDPNKTAEPLTAEEASQCIGTGLDHLGALLAPLELEDGRVESIRASMASDLAEVMQEPGLAADIEADEFNGLASPITLVIEKNDIGNGDYWLHFLRGIIPERDFVTNPDPEYPEYTVFSPGGPGLPFSICHPSEHGLGLFNYRNPQVMPPRQADSGVVVFRPSEIAPDDEGPRWGFLCDVNEDGVIEIDEEFVAHHEPFWHWSIHEEGGISENPPCGTDIMESAMNAGHLDDIHQAVGAFESSMGAVVDRWKGSGATAWTEYEVIHFEE